MIHLLNVLLFCFLHPDTAPLAIWHRDGSKPKSLRQAELWAAVVHGGAISAMHVQHAWEIDQMVAPTGCALVLPTQHGSQQLPHDTHISLLLRSVQVLSLSLALPCPRVLLYSIASVPSSSLRPLATASLPPVSFQHTPFFHSQIQNKYT